MGKKEITFADVSRSINRLEGFIDDFLLKLQCNEESFKKTIIQNIDDVKWNREGYEEFNYIGIRDCVDFILNNQSMLLAERVFRIESKIKEAEQIMLLFSPMMIKEKMAKEIGDLFNETGLILCEIGELYIEPFVIPNDYPEIPKELLDLFPTKKQCQDFVQRNYRKSAPIVAYAYLEEKGVINPHDSKNDIPVIAILYKYFVKPFDEREGARTNFYNFFKQK